MWLKESNPGCCEDFDPLPKQVNCLVPEICCELNKLICRHEKSFVRRKRLMELAEPARRRCRTVLKCPCKFRRPIEIIRLDKLEHTRTEQLAYPTVRRLLLFKKQIRHLFEPYRVVIFNRLLRKSLLSVYSRLNNTQPPSPPKKTPKWDKKDWAKHGAKLAKLAKPKVPKEPPIEKPKKRGISEMERLEVLAIPKKYDLQEKPEWKLTEAMNKHKATKRENELSKPVFRDNTVHIREFPFPIPTGVLKYKASKRVEEIAQPNVRRANTSADAEFKENPFAVSPQALKNKPSKRIKELAEPREYENTHIRENPYAISPAALVAKPRPRIIELAQPRKRD